MKVGRRNGKPRAIFISSRSVRPHVIRLLAHDAMSVIRAPVHKQQIIVIRDSFAYFDVKVK